MKRQTAFGITGFVLAIGTVATTALAAPHWTESTESKYREFIQVCPEDQLISYDPMRRERDEWAIQCGVVSDRWKTKFFFDFSDDGGLIPRHAILYPSFGLANTPGVVWIPDLRRNIDGTFVTCGMPADVVWKRTCS